MAGTANDNNALLLQVSADISRLEKQFQKASGIVDKQSSFMERRAKQMATKLEGASKVDFGKALDNVFDSTRLRVLDSGIAKIGLFGSALEPLGVLGIAAAGGIAAVGAALAGARQAAAYADDIGDMANKLHVTTDALQEYRYAIRAAGGDEKGADEALEAFSINLGKAQQGLAKGQRAFLALGFTKEQIKSFKDADDALNQVVSKISGLSSIQQDAIIDQLGLDGIKPLIAAGADEMARLRDEAHKLGLVMDSELVKRGGDLNDQFETVSKVIDVQMKSALVDLGPILLGLLDLVSKMARTANDIAESFKDIQDRTQTSLERQKTVLEMRMKIAATPFAKSNVQAELDKVNNAIAAKKSVVTVDDIKKQFGITDPHTSLKDTSKTGSTPKDQTVGRTAAVDSAVASADRALLQALLSLTDDANTRAEIQKKILDAEQAQADAAYQKQKNDIETDKTLTAATKTKLLADLAAARATQQETDAVQRRGIDAEALADLDKKRLDRHRKLADQEIAELQAQADLTNSRKERRKIELEILDRRKKLDDEARANEQADRQRRADASSPAGTTTVLVSDGGVQKAADKKYQADQAKIFSDTQGAIADYLDSIKSLDDAMQDAAVDGLQALNDGIADLIVNGSDAASVLKNILNKVLIDLINSQTQSIEKGIFSYFSSGRRASQSGIKADTEGSFTPSFDGGGWTGPGGRSGGVDGKGGFYGILHPNESIIDHTKNLPSMSQISSARQAPHIYAPLMQISAGSDVVSAAWVDSLNVKLKQTHDAALASFKKALPGEINKINAFGTN